jgi:hypothetical protein
MFLSKNGDVPVPGLREKKKKELAARKCVAPNKTTRSQFKNLKGGEDSTARCIQ